MNDWDRLARHLARSFLWGWTITYPLLNQPWPGWRFAIQIVGWLIPVTMYELVCWMGRRQRRREIA